MAGKRKKKKKAGVEKVKGSAKSLTFIADEDEDILDEANEIRKLRRFKSVRPAVRDIIYDALKRERIRLDGLNRAS